jgi:Fic family protein
MADYEKAVELWRGYQVATEADIDTYLDNFRVLFAYNSVKIENDEVTYHDTREIFENGKAVNYTGSPRALFELHNQKLCYELLKPAIVRRDPLTIELIKETHATLTQGTYDEHRYIQKGERPGEFKRHDYVTGREEVGSPVEYVEGDLRDLLDEMTEYEGKGLLKVAAYFHARFEYIHPFADGNGRTGRTLLNYYLMCHDHPPLIIYDEDKDRYYQALEAYDTKEELEPLRRFLVEQTEKTWAKSLAREQARRVLE